MERKKKINRFKEKESAEHKYRVKGSLLVS